MEVHTTVDGEEERNRLYIKNLRARPFSQSYDLAAMDSTRRRKKTPKAQIRLMKPVNKSINAAGIEAKMFLPITNPSTG
jgi:hypothetical protein